MTYNILIFSSVTYALKARGVLEREGIKAKLEKLKKNQILHGCGYGLKIKNSDVLTSRGICEREGIKIIDIFEY